MADFDDADNMLNMSDNKFNSVGIVRDSDDARRNTVSIVNFGQGNNANTKRYFYHANIWKKRSKRKVCSFRVKEC